MKFVNTFQLNLIVGLSDVAAKADDDVSVGVVGVVFNPAANVVEDIVDADVELRRHPAADRPHHDEVVRDRRLVRDAAEDVVARVDAQQSAAADERRHRGGTRDVADVGVDLLESEVRSSDRVARFRLLRRQNVAGGHVDVCAIASLCSTG